MAFENSPRLESPTVSRPSFLGRVHQFRHIILALAIAAALFSLAAMAIFLLRVVYSPQPGGLDGCLVTASGAPFVTTVRVGAVTVPTDMQGCFFFSSLPAGEQQLFVMTPGGEVSQPTTIVSNQATILGAIRITP